MAGVCKLEIAETVPQLKALLNDQKTASGFQKIQALYLFKIGQVKTVKELALTLGVNRITVQRWLRQYRHQGMAGLLQVKQSGVANLLFHQMCGQDYKNDLMTPIAVLRVMEKFKSGCSKNIILMFLTRLFMLLLDIS